MKKPTDWIDYERARMLDEADATQIFDPGHSVSPEQSARIAQHFEIMNDPPRPSGWWITPVAILGAIAWVLIVWVLL